MSARDDGVVPLHGLGRNAASLERPRSALEAAGYLAGAFPTRARYTAIAIA